MLGSIWQFLKDPANLAVLGSIGAGIAAIAGGAWAVFTFFARKSDKGPFGAERQSRSRQRRGGPGYQCARDHRIDEKGSGRSFA